MRKIYLVSALLFAGMGLRAQVINKDSISLVERIAKDKQKLEEMKGQVEEREKAKKETADKAQESADDNRKAAKRLSDDPQDRKLARRADNSASDARSDAKAARKASDQLDRLNRDIRNLTERIAKEETKLKKYEVEAKNE